MALPDVLLIIPQAFIRVGTRILSQDCQVLEPQSVLQTYNAKVRCTTWR